MRRITRDFITLFNVLWYRDFPLTKQHKETGSRAEWTTHIGICARSAADLMGYFTYFEHGNRTDAVIKDNREEVVANLEWEWKEPRYVDKVNEIQQLHKVKDKCKFSVFVSYSDNRHYEENIDCVFNQWGIASEPLVLIIIRFNRAGGRRLFDLMETHHIQNGSCRKVRSQPALPWETKGKRWESK
ncbi:hypothetical protein [Gilvimarinus algae]|uniref:TIR domain-containing protein n=1 Tax=Gilvimarinus algae TaxID=3058037 RepID=A0ABT8TG12_9GAMM|nr:hypothetical protein [Gilvimarinus sp. SDUM040014]MDO3382464.1 hypothetical protein [Gilvimarinus sp. SDUM040014]